VLTIDDARASTRAAADATLEGGAQVGRPAGVADLRGPREHLGKQRLHLQPGEVRTEAEVRAIPEREVRVRGAGYSKTLGSGNTASSRFAAAKDTTTCAGSQRAAHSPRP